MSNFTGNGSLVRNGVIYGGSHDTEAVHWSEATTSVKKNLLPITLAELKSLNTTGTWNNNIYTLNGLTYTITTDRGYISQISVSGTASAETHLQLGAWMKLGDLSYRFNGVSNTTTGIMWISSASGTYTLTSSVSEVSFTSHTSDDWAIYITYGNGTTPSGEVFKPMLRDASISDSTYVPYIKDNVELDADKADKTQITNPNLLDNPWFTVNQRGITTLSAGGDVYTVDRWMKSANTITFALDSDGTVTLTNTGTATPEWRQRIEPSFAEKYLNGKTFTLSVLKNGVVYSATDVYDYSANANFAQIDIGDAIVGLRNLPTLTYRCFVRVIFKANTQNKTVSGIQAIKLELGSVSTLAQDTAPNYATELLKCQRYFYRLQSDNSYGLLSDLGYVNSTSDVRVPIILPVPMRAKPSLSASGALRVFNAIDNNSMSTAVTLISPLHSIEGTLGHLRVTATNSDFVSGKIVALAANNDNNAYIDFSADL